MAGALTVHQPRDKNGVNLGEGVTQNWSRWLRVYLPTPPVGQHLGIKSGVESSVWPVQS